jgi:predicted metalloprotease with PDZ domain
MMLPFYQYAAMNDLACTLLLAMLAAGAAHASPGPQPASAPPSIPAPRDSAFQGAIALHVDATDVAHKIFLVQETIPVQQAGEMVLLYPQWETASHAPTLEAAPLAGLVIMAGTQRLDWWRDPADPFAFHVTVPQGATQLDIAFQHLPALNGPKSLTPALLMLQWQKVALYPAGWFTRNIAVRPTLTIPAGFAHASTLDTANVAGNRIAFNETSFEDLVDAPVYAGLYVQRVTLSADGAVPVRLTMFGDTPAALRIPPGLLASYRTMAATVPQLFRAQPYRHFDFLMSLSDTLLSGGGTEHQESTEINLPADYFSNRATQMAMANLVPHEFIHAWNGRTRQPADLWQPNLNLPIGGSLLWVYEGQSEFWANVIAARTGLATPQQTVDALALEAAKASTRAGRAWKSLRESNRDPVYMAGKTANWRDWQRRSDFYGEGVLLWLDVDMLLRELTGEQRGLEDFAASFFGMGGNDRTITTYTFADVCAALGAIAPYDWAGYFATRLQAHDDTHLLDGLTRAGYRLGYADTPNAAWDSYEADLGAMDLSLSLGLSIGKKGAVKTVAWEGPAFKAGISLGARLTSVNGQAYTDDGLRAAIATRQPVLLGYDADGAARTVTVGYSGGLRYPRLERIAGAVDRLVRLLDK